MVQITDKTQIYRIRIICKSVKNPLSAPPEKLKVLSRFMYNNAFLLFKRKTYPLFSLFAGFFLSQVVIAQLVVNNTNPNNNATYLVQNILMGNGVSAFNVVFTGDSIVPVTQIGFFRGINSNIGLDSGIVLSTGNVMDAVGPNTGNVSTNQNGQNDKGSDADLNSIVGGNPAFNQDKAVLEFDFIPIGDSVEFQYVFASEEYNEYVCGTVNDVFGFFISGPGITGPFFNNAQNIALIPGTTVPVSINSVNNGSVGQFGTPGNCISLANSAFFVDNTGGTTVQYDGFTTVLTATATVQCGQVYHIKMAIQDVGDGAFDSGVFLKAQSFTSKGIEISLNTVMGDANMYEGCSDATIDFIRQNTDTQAVVYFTIGGTATNGVDYAFIPDSVIMPIGEDTSSVTVTLLADIINEGTETITITVYNITCSGDTVIETATLFINEGYGLDMVSVDDTVLCANDTVSIASSASGGLTPYNYSWNNGMTGSQITVSTSVTDSFIVTASDLLGCKGLDTVMVTVLHPLPIVDAGNDTALCIGNFIQIGGFPAGPAGAIFAWIPSSTLDDTTLANPSANPVISTTYIVSVTDTNTCVNYDTVIVSVNNLPFADAGTDTTICTGNSVQIGGFPTGPTGSTYSWSPSGTLNDATLENPIATPVADTEYIVVVTDTNGCENTDTINVLLFALPVAEASNDTAICIGDTIQLNASGGISFSWSPSLGLSDATVPDPNAFPAVTTTYIVTVSDNNNCSDTESVVITVNILGTAEAGNDTSICIGDIIQIGGSPTGSPGSDFFWSPNISINDTTIANPDVSPISTITYFVTVTDINSCSSSDSIVVTVNNLPVADAGNDTSICAGNSVQIGGTPTGANGSLFSWTPSGTLDDATLANPAATPIADMDYIVVVTDTNNCVNSDTVSVSLFALPVAIASNDTVICTGDTILLTASGGIFFTWNPGGSLSDSTVFNPVAYPSATTVYTVTVTDANGCTDTETVTVTVNNLPAVDAGNDTAICIGDTIQIGGTPTSATGTDFSWSPNISINGITLANPEVFPNATIVYTVVVTDANSCINSDSIMVTVNDLPVVDAGQDTIICNGISVVIGGNPTGPSGSSYSWSPSTSLNNATDENPVANPSSNITYTVVVTDVNGCVNSDGVNFIVNPNPVADAGNDEIICAGDSAQLNGSGGGNYEWIPAGSLTNPIISNPIAFPSNTTTYFLIVTDINNCTDTDSVAVIINPLPLADAGPDLWICPNDSIQITASGGIIYSWFPAAGLSDPNIANPMASPSDTTVYYVTVTDINGCVNSDSMKLDVGALVPTDAGADKSICIGDSVQIGGSPTAPAGSTYSWTPSAGLSDTAIANPLASPTDTTIYYVSAQNFTCIGLDFVKVIVRPLPVISVAVVPPAICIGDTSQLTASAAGVASFQWFPADSLSNTTAFNPLANPSDTTTYFVTVTDTNGCVNTDSITLIVNPLPVVNVTAVSDVICNGDTSQLSASGGVNYIWSPADSLTDANISNPLAFPSDTTTFVVIVTDGNNCVNSDSVTVIVNPLPVISITGNFMICTGDTTQLNASGGISFSWNPSTDLSNANIANPFAFPTDTTTFTVTVTDGNNCVNTDSATIIVNPLPLVDAGITDTICAGDTAQLNASGANDFSWLPPGSLSDATIQNPVAFPLSPTVFYVTGTDANGCSNNDSVEIFVNSLPVISIAGNLTICAGDTTQLNASGGSSYIWAPAASLSNPNISNPLAFPSDTTTYTVTVTDDNNCTNSDSVTVTINPIPVISITGNFIICFGDTTQLNASGGTSFSWNPPADLSNPDISNPFAFPSDTTTFTVTVTDGNNCVNTDSATIIVNPLPIVDVGINDTVCAGDSIQLNATGATNYVWNPITNLTNPNISNPLAFPVNTIIYYVEGTDNNNCANMDSVEVFVNPLPLITITSDVDICMGDSVQLNASGGINYMWVPGGSLTDATISNPIAFPSDTTTYVVAVADVNNCVNSDSVTVTVNPLPFILITGNFTICIGDTTQLNASGGNTYLWNPAISLSNANVANPLAFPSDTTTFFVTVTDANLCENSDSVTIIVNMLPSVDAGINDTVCAGNSAQLNASGATGYLWSPSGNLNDITVQNPLASPLSTTIFYVTGTDNNGCSANDSVEIFVHPLPVIDAGSDTVTACSGQSVQLNAIGSANIIQFQWNPATGLSDATIPDPIVTISGTQLYFITVIDSNNCSNTDSIVVGIFNSPLIDAGTDVSICAGDTVLLIATGGVNYSWSPTASLDDPNNDSTNAFPLNTTTYFISATDTNGCNGIDSVLVSVVPLPDAPDANDASACFGEPVPDLSAAGNNIQWYDASGTFVFSGNPFPTGQTNPGTYNYTLTQTENGCEGTASFAALTIYPLPVADAGNDTSGCSGAVVQLNASGGIFYQWLPTTGLNNPNISNPVATLLSDSIQYFVTVTDANGCKNIDSVIVKAFSIIISNDTSICTADSAMLMVTAVSGYFPYTYLWTPSGSLNSGNIANPLSAPISTTIYFVTVTDNNGCSDSADVRVVVNENPLSDFTFKLEPSCIGAVAVFENKSENADSYLWIFPDETSAKVNPEHQFLYNQSMNVTLVAINNSGCNDSSSITQNIKSFDNYFDIVAPNVFTPNGDGQNDLFELRFDNKLQECTDLKVFNRWGEMIFSSSGNQHSWNGRTFAGTEAPNGTYFYIFDINGKEFKGAVTLIR